MHLKAGTYYHVVGKKRQWVPIGKTYAEAIVEYAKREAATFKRGEMFADLADEFLLRILPSFKPKTQKEWRRCIGLLKKSMQGVRAADLEPSAVADMRDSLRATPGIANRMLTIVKTAYSYGVEWGYVRRNPCTEIRPIRVEDRTRYLADAEFHAIRACAPPVVAAAMAISYMTGLRIGDVLALTVREVTDDGITVRQQKNAVAGRYPMTDEMRAAVTLAKQDRKVGSMHVIARRDGKPFSYYGFRSMFARACERAKVEGVTFHDIRAKAITDAKRAGRDPQSFSLHKTRAQAEAYVRARDVPTVEPLALPIVESDTITHGQTKTERR